MEKQHALLGHRSKRILRIGDSVRVKVAAVNPATRRIEFVLVEHRSSTPLHSAATVEIILPDEQFPRIPVRGKGLKGITPRNTEKRTPGSKGNNKEKDRGRSGRKR